MLTQCLRLHTRVCRCIRVFLAAEHVNGMLLAKPVKTIAKGACLFLGMFVANVVLTDRWFTMAATLLLMMLAIAL